MPQPEHAKSRRPRDERVREMQQKYKRGFGEGDTQVTMLAELERIGDLMEELIEVLRPAEQGTTA